MLRYRKKRTLECTNVVAGSLLRPHQVKDVF
jgi:hypothetical protein